MLNKTALNGSLILLVFLLASVAGAADEHWPHWRGPRANGTAPNGSPPLRWDEKTNVQWKVKLPGKGSSTPILWGERLFVTTAVDTKRQAKPDDLPKRDPQFRVKTKPPETYYQFMVMCLHRKTGKVLWQRVAAEEVPHEGMHSTHSYAAGSPVTDGKRVYVSFGSRGIYCYDFDGKLQWKARLGTMHTRYGWGEASTPALHKDRVIINWDHEGQSYIYALDAATGKIHWQQKRDEPTSWNTPLIVERNGKTQVIVNGTNRARGYDLATGKVLWQCGGQTVNAIPSPILYGDTVICMSGYRGSAAIAIPLDAKGDITGSKHIRWKISKATPYIASPVLLGKRLYFTVSMFAVLNCVDVETGKVIYQKRLGDLGRLYASPVAAAGRIYVTDRTGMTMVLQAGDTFKVLAVNRLAEPIDASPVVVGAQMFLRSHHHLYCLQQRNERD